MDNFLKDLRYGLRNLLKKPGFTFIAVLTLALGIGANTAIFSVVSAVLLNSPPYKDPDRLVMVWGKNPEWQLDQEVLPASNADFTDWRDQNNVFESLAALYPDSINLTASGDPERVGGVSASTNFFRTLGVEAALGRTFLPEDEKLPVVLLSHGLWQRRFNSDPDIIDSLLALNGKSHTVIGVLPSRFEFPQRPDMLLQIGFPRRIDLWMPLEINPPESRGNRTLAVIGRMKSNVTLDQAQSDMSGIAGRLEQQYPRSNEGLMVSLSPLQEETVRKIRPALLVLFGAVGFVLLIACANVANLLLSRATDREKEMAIRLALGASRGQIVRQLLTESLLLSTGGGAAGLLLASWGTGFILAFSPGNIPRMSEIMLDNRALLFTLLLSAATGIAFGLAPALQASNLHLTETIKEGGRGSTSGRHRTRNILVILEVALTLVLLAGAGLMIRSFFRLQDVNPGFDTKNVLTMQVPLPLEKYPRYALRADFFRQVTEKIEALPGVKSAGLAFQVPMSGAAGGVGFEIEGREPDPQLRTIANIRQVNRGYLPTMGITVLQGRGFIEQDYQLPYRTAIVSETMARRFWPDEEAVGKRIKLFGNSLEIIGTVKDVKHTSLDAEPGAELYIPYLLWNMHLVVRTDSDPLSMIAAVREQIQSIDKDQPVSDVTTMEQLLAASVSARRFNMLLLGIFAAVALALATTGIYGVISYGIAQREREIGIRMALGATSRDVLRLVISQGMRVALAGIAAGVAASLALTRLMSSLLYQVSANDPAIIAGISILLVLASLAACYIPARRATRVDPVVALKHE